MRNRLFKLGALVGLGVYLYKENTDTFGELSYLVISSLYETYTVPQGVIGPIFHNAKSDCYNMAIVDDVRNEGYVVGFYGMSETEVMLLAKTFKLNRNN